MRQTSAWEPKRVLSLYLQCCEVSSGSCLAQALNQLLLPCFLLPEVCKRGRQAVCGQHLCQLIPACHQARLFGPDVQPFGLVILAGVQPLLQGHNTKISKLSQRADP